MVAKDDTQVAMPTCLMTAIEKADCKSGNPSTCGIIEMPQFHDGAGRDVRFWINTPQWPITRDQAQEVVQGLMGNCTEWVPYRNASMPDGPFDLMTHAYRRTYKHDGYILPVDVRWSSDTGRVTINLLKMADQVPLVTRLSAGPTSGGLPARREISLVDDSAVEMPACLATGFKEFACTAAKRVDGRFCLELFNEREVAAFDSMFSGVRPGAGRTLMFANITPPRPITENQEQDLVTGLMRHCTDWQPYHPVGSMPDVADSWTRRMYQHRRHVLQVSCGPFSWVRGKYLVRVSVYHPPTVYEPPPAEKVSSISSPKRSY